MEPQAAIFAFTGGICVAGTLATVWLVIHELRWRDRLNTERLTAKDRECAARLDGTTDAAANIFRKVRYPSNDEARAETVL